MADKDELTEVLWLEEDLHRYCPDKNRYEVSDHAGHCSRASVARGDGLTPKFRGAHKA